MLDGNLPVGRAENRHADLGQPPGVLRKQGDAHLVGRDKDKEQPAVDHVDGQVAQALDCQRHILPVDERRDVVERHGGYPPTLNLGTHPHWPGSCIEREPGLRLTAFDQTRLQRGDGHTDDRVPAHRLVSLVVHEDQPQVGLRMARLDEQRAEQVFVAARLKQQVAGQPAQVGFGIGQLLGHRLTPNRGQTADDQSSALASRVRVDGMDYTRDVHGGPPLYLSPGLTAYSRPSSLSVTYSTPRSGS